MQSQIVCSGCRSVLLYPRGATNVCCAFCNALTPVPPPQLPPPVSNVAHVNCGNCRTTLMYPYGAPSVKCAVCHYITNVNMSNTRVPIPMHQPSGTVTPPLMPSTSSQGLAHSQSQTVVVENPMSVDKSGKLVSNVVVGVTTEKK
ncbi:protein LOL3-like isoform X4 [Coffea arabica]|uniref:Protein LOL3-like isoform X4 n=1 Tax=Coffea arabica TaxID=13443 RepID=A0ABM4UVJ1_COFAR